MDPFFINSSIFTKESFSPTHSVQERKSIPKIYCLETGGTFSSAPSLQGRKPAKGIEEIIKQFIPDVSEFAKISSPCCGSDEHFGSLIDSSNAQPEDWARIARLVNSVLKKGKHDGVVITMGTDTMAFCASALSIMLPNPSKPIVLTGSQRGFDQDNSDARENLLSALLAAGDLTPGIYIVFGGNVIHGFNVTKFSTIADDAFYDPISFSRDGCVNVAARKVLSEYKEKGLHLPKDILFDCFDNNVKVEKLIPGYEPEWLEQVLSDDSVHGVVLEAFGLGGIPTQGARNIQKIIEKYVNKKPIIIKSQVPHGPTDISEYEVGLRALRAGVLSASTLTLESATFGLKWLLGQTRDVNLIRILWPDFISQQLKPFSLQ